MKRWFALALFLGLSALALPLPQVYDRLEETLRQVRLENPTQALSALDRAQSLLRQESEGLPPVLRDATLLYLQDARQAVLKQSRVDLEARLFLVRHLLGKALYDGFFQAPAAEKPQYLSRLIRATGLPQARVQGVEGLPIEEARLRLEGAYLGLLTESLSQALSATSRPQAYLALAQAYARFLVIQDSPQSTLKAQDFIQALSRVSEGQNFHPPIKDVLQKARIWQKQLQIPPPSAESSPGPSTRTPSAAPPASSPPSPPAPSLSPVPRPEKLPSAIQKKTDLPRLEPQTAARLEATLQRLAIPSPSKWLDLLDEVRSSVAQAQVYTAAGRYDRARTQLAYAYSRFRLEVYPVVEAYAPELAERTDRLFLAMQNAVGLRTVDFTVLLGEIQEIEERLQGSSLGPRHALQVQLQLFLLGIPRAILFLLPSVLAFFSFYLGWITFSRRNVHWKLLGLSLLFLVLPVAGEGLSYISSILAGYGELPVLGPLTHLSIAQGLVPYLAWGISAFLGVALAGAGLRGIAAQFGLLKRRGREVATLAEQKPSATTLTSETLVDWDKEF